MKDESPEDKSPDLATRTQLNNLFFVIRVLGLYPDVVTYLASGPDEQKHPSHLVSCAQGEEQIDEKFYLRLLQIVGVTNEALSQGDRDHIKKRLIEDGRQLWDVEECLPEEAPEHLQMLKRYKCHLVKLTRLRERQVKQKNGGRS